MENNFVFLSTQIQGHLDDWELDQSKTDSLSSKISDLKRDYAKTDVKATQEVPIKKKIIKRKKMAKVPKQRKVKSITSHVTNAHKDQQTSIMKILSGKKRKVNDILNSLKVIEEQKPETTNDNEEIQTASILYGKEEWINIVRSINLHFPHLSRPSKVTLSLITKKYLEYSNSNSRAIVSGQPGQAGEASRTPAETFKKNDETVSLWHMAATPPAQRLTDEELRWLYDIGEQDDVSINGFADSSFVDPDPKNVLTLSQVLGSKSSLGNDDSYLNNISQVEIPNSSPEPEMLSHRTRPIENLKSQAAVSSPPIDNVNDFNGHNFAPSGTLLYEDNTPDIEEVFQSYRKVGDSQMNAIRLSSGSDNSPVYEEQTPVSHFENLPIPVSKKAELEVPKSFTEFRFSKQPANVRGSLSDVERNEAILPSEIVTSSPPTITRSEEFLARKREASTPMVNELSSSLPGESNIDQLPNSISEEADTDLVRVDEDSESLRTVYSTALSQLYFTQRQDETRKGFETSELPSEPLENRSTEVSIRGRLARSNPHKAVFRRKLVDLRGPTRMEANTSNTTERYEDNDDEVSIITTKVIGVQRRTFDIDEIPNSSSDEDEVSIIEIVREIKHDNLGAIEVASSQKAIPSSPLREDQGCNLSLEVADAMDNGKQNRADELEVISETEGDDEQAVNNDNELEDLTKLTNNELKERLNAWGLKIGKSRAKMIDTLSQASKIISQSQKTQNNSQSQVGMDPLKEANEVRNQIFGRITYVIKESRDLYKKVLLFEPIKMVDFQNCLKSNDIELDPSLLREYCDMHGIILLGGDNDKEVGDADADEMDDN